MFPSARALRSSLPRTNETPAAIKSNIMETRKALCMPVTKASMGAAPRRQDSVGPEAPGTGRAKFPRIVVLREALPRSAIRPYPIQYVGKAVLKNAKRVTIRPILHQDEPLFIKFHETLSEQSVYLRYFQALKLSQRVTHERLMRRCFIDYNREMALVAEGKNEQGEREILTWRVGDVESEETWGEVFRELKRRGLISELPVVETLGKP